MPAGKSCYMAAQVLSALLCQTEKHMVEGHDLYALATSMSKSLE